MKYRMPLLLLLAAAGLAQAQVYRSVGPDGKVVYTDSPPADAGSGLSTVDVKDNNSQSSDQAPADTSQPAATPAPKKPKHVANKAATPSALVPVVPDAALINAVTIVAGLEDMVNQTRNICIRTLPNGFEKYTAAADAWAQRNAVVVAQKNRVLAQAFSDADGAALVAKAKAHNQQTLAPVLGGTSAKRLGWCDKSSDDMSKGTLDAFNNPALSGPLSAFK